MNLGDYTEDYATLNTKFTTRTSAGVPFTLAGSPVISVYKANNTTQSVAGVTLTADFDSVTGLNNVLIDLSADAFYAVANDYQVVITTGTVDGVSVVGEVVAEFSIENRDSSAGATWDRVLTGATHNIATSAGRRLRGIQEFQGYELGSIWIDTTNGTAGTTDYENGTVENPVDTIADANTLAASLGITRFQVAPGSSFTFAASQEGQAFFGTEWTLALGGQSIANSYIEGATVSGIGTGTGHHFVHCAIGTISVSDGSMGWCQFTSTITLTGANDSYWHDCYSGVAGSSTPVVDFGAAVGNSNLNMRRYSGGIQIDNKDATGTDLMSIEGDGQLIVSASSGGAISVRGNFKVTNTGGATITYDDNTSSITLIEADTNELQTDWTNGGRLDLILDAILADTSTTLDTKIDAIKTVTDKFIFTVANQVDSNVKSVNDVTITGDGSGTPFNV